MTKKDNEDSADINITVPTGGLRVEGFSAGALVQASATAVNSLSTATEIASSTGHDEIAATGKALQGSLQSVFNITDSNVTIYNFPTVNIIEQQSITIIESQINNYTTAMEASNVPFFDCKDKFDKCMSNAADAGAQLHCKLLYSACLANKGASTFIPFL